MNTKITCFASCERNVFAKQHAEYGIYCFLSFDNSFGKFWAEISQFKMKKTKQGLSLKVSRYKLIAKTWRLPSMNKAIIDANEINHCIYKKYVSFIIQVIFYLLFNML